ncbi:MAG: DeoR family transcriptional regulator, partial [Planctomycetes bacterium]|nr:DeoR family transcriptional regulator [Planctomycetota bacterium]
AYTLHQEEISNGILRRLTGADSRQATSELQDLVTKGLLQQTGSRRWTTYRLSAKAAQTPEEEAARIVTSRMTAEERQERIYQLIARRGTAAIRTIADELGIALATARYDVRKLVEAARIERTSEDARDPRNQYRVR